MEQNYEKRLVDIANFMHDICIEGGCGYELKGIVKSLICGNINYEQAINEWHRWGWKTFG